MQCYLELFFLDPAGVVHFDSVAGIVPFRVLDMLRYTMEKGNMEGNQALLGREPCSVDGRLVRERDVACGSGEEQREMVRSGTSGAVLKDRYTG